MVILYMPKPDLPLTLGWIHEATDWKLATSPTMEASTIVASSLENTTDLTSIVLNFDLNPDITYYAKARVICNKSIFESDIGILKVSDFIKITHDYPIPSVVVKPTIGINYDPTNVPNSNFTITTGNMSSTSNAIHESSSYIIETLDGEPVYSKLFSKDDLIKKVFDDVILSGNRSYIIKVIHHSSSNDSSTYAEQLITVRDNSKINLVSNLDNRNVSAGFTMLLDPINNLKNTNVKIHAVGHGDGVNTYNITTTSLNKLIPSQAFDRDTNKFLIELKTTLNDNSIIGPKYYEITTTD